jgi:hypothetical protein
MYFSGTPERINDSIDSHGRQGSCFGFGFRDVEFSVMAAPQEKSDQR